MVKVLTELAVKDFAIIDELRLEFNGGLNILTGETGAGKSILVDALGALLGDKVHGEQVRSGASEARVEAVFSGCNGPWIPFFKDRSIAPEADGSLFLQRRITRQGRHQAYINGHAVPIGLLADVGSRLVDIHGQHQHQTLLKVPNHMEIVDDYGGLSGLRQEFRENYYRIVELKKKMDRATEDGKARESRKDFIVFQLKEIEAAGLQEREDEELERARTAMLNSEKINLLVREALELLYEGEAAAAGQVELAASKVEDLADYLADAGTIADDLKGCDAVIREASDSLKKYLHQAEYDPEEHNRIEERLALISRLKRKYGSTVREIIEKGSAFGEELSRLEEEGSLLGDWSRELERLLVRLGDIGGRLTKKRTIVARGIEKEVGVQLTELGMKKARFTIGFTPRLREDGLLDLPGGRYEPWEGGLEEAEFFLSANPGEKQKSLIRVASGGELSRIMLAIKTALAQVDRVATLIFDEIDTGIGGSVARVVGRKLKKLSEERQVICVTHLPQIASLADAHFVVLKDLEGEKVRVKVKRLDNEDKIEEIARMIAGETVTSAAVLHARELMEG